MTVLNMISVTTYLLLVGALAVFVLILIDREARAKKKKTRARVYINRGDRIEILKQAPGPEPWPILGSLYILAKYDVPYKAFSVLAEKYNSQVIKIKLGSLPCIIVNGFDNIKEVLFTRNYDFDSRPNFVRYNRLFGGDKGNSLAFSDWTELQKSRREMLRNHTFPRALTYRYHELNVMIASEVENLLAHLDRPLDTMKVAVKPLVLSTCANIFTGYFCARRFDWSDNDFRRMIENFDGVFWEVNQGYAADFLPFLMPFHRKNLDQVAEYTHEIREFVVDKIVSERRRNWAPVSDSSEEACYLDNLIEHIQSKASPEMSWDTALYALEDIIGGHAAIGNLLVKVFGFLVNHRHVQERAQKEIDSLHIVENTVGLEHKKSLPYVEGIILEAVRLVASPIVPHVANKHSSVAGFSVEKDTFIFLNNYELNMSKELWKDPESFDPQRFITSENKILKPEYFLPFGGGRRSCMGYKLVHYVSFSVLASVLKNFTILPVENQVYKVPVGSLALPKVTFNFRFERR
ncbi:cytochrome P450 307a1-like [Microplitis mediator]|uniref:cytochrome P450 307a1-like n=1 Tax=Microplitis mediator TaxID=375433 RepID=UPI002554D988|nr:cytochrome P450 307a1-like [Microplitis mediator]